MDSERTIVVTGSSTGIGAACALRLSSMGFTVFAGVRRQSDGEALQRQAAGQLTPLPLDVTSADDIASAVDTVRLSVGSAGLAGLVNNAGIAVACPLEFLPLDELRRQLEVNVVGQMAVTKAFLPLLRQGHGRIVNMGSIGGLIAGPFTGAYHASKFAMEALTDSLRLELHGSGVFVSLVEPGTIATPIWEKSATAADRLLTELPPEIQQFYGSRMARARAGALKSGQRGIPPDRVAHAVIQALTADRPKTRYLVGWDARLLALVALLPDRLRDWLTLHQ